MTIDRNSDTWRHIHEFIVKEIETLQEELEHPMQGDESTALIRGRIFAMRTVLSLGQAPAEQQAAALVRSPRPRPFTARPSRHKCCRPTKS